MQSDSVGDPGQSRVDPIAGTVTWRLTSPTGAAPAANSVPSPREPTYDPVRRRVILANCPFPTDEIFSLDLAGGGDGVWRLQTTMGSLPDQRRAATAGVGTSGELMIFGGGNGTILGDTWTIGLP